MEQIERSENVQLKQRLKELEMVNEELMQVYERAIQYRKVILHDAVLFFEANLTKGEIITNTLEEMQEEDVSLEAVKIKSYSDHIQEWGRQMSPDSVEGFRQFFDENRLIRSYHRGELEQTHDAWMLDRHGRKKLCYYILLLRKNERTGDIVALVVVKDNTEQMGRQMLLQSALRQAQSAHIAKDAFLVNMSHDIRTPLNVIIGYAELLRNRKSDPDKVDAYLDKICSYGEQLSDILNESLEITRMASGRINLFESACSLQVLLAEIEKAMTPAMAAKSICFSIDSTKVEHFAVIADFIRLKEVLMRLLDNAVKYMNPNGTIKMAIIETAIDMKGYKKYSFVVEDNGIGISDEFKEQMFEPFKRENNTTNSGVLGIGLGLTVVKNIVEMMEGEIEAESELGKGSKFTVNLLLKLQETLSKSKIYAVNSLHKGARPEERRLLVVEDNEVNGEIVEELLKDKGYPVERAANGKIALELIKKSEPGYFAAVLMDIQMPVMDGYEATREIRTLDNSALAQIPIIALSANAFAEDYQKSIDAGMVAHLPKPININNLHELISDILG